MADVPSGLTVEEWAQIERGLSPEGCEVTSRLIELLAKADAPMTTTELIGAYGAISRVRATCGDRACQDPLHLQTEHHRLWNSDAYPRLRRLVERGYVVCLVPGRVNGKRQGTGAFSWRLRSREPAPEPMDPAELIGRFLDLERGLRG